MSLCCSVKIMNFNSAVFTWDFIKDCLGCQNTVQNRSHFFMQTKTHRRNVTVQDKVLWFQNSNLLSTGNLKNCSLFVKKPTFLNKTATFGKFLQNPNRQSTRTFFFQKNKSKLPIRIQSFFVKIQHKNQPKSSSTDPNPLLFLCFQKVYIFSEIVQKSTVSKQYCGEGF